MKLLRSVLLLISLALGVNLMWSAPEETNFGGEIVVEETEIASAGSDTSFKGKIVSTWKDFTGWCRENHVADNLEVGATLGTPGIGLEVSTPVTRWVNVRAGVEWLPRVAVPMSFRVSTYTDGLPSNNFSHVSQMLYELTGIQVDDKVKMKGRATMVNFKLLVDVYPFQNNRHWHFTAGFFAGTSMVADAYNYPKEKPTLVGLNVYNRAYQYFTNLQSIFDVPLGGGTYMDPEMVLKIQQKLREYGRMGIRIGDFKDGQPYIMEPSPDGSVSARAFVNHFKPYLGFGYGGYMDPLQKWYIGLEAGVLFWGGAPDVINHDYATGRDVNFTKDLHNIRGKVGTYMDLVHALPVYPVLSVKVSYTIF